MAKVTFFHNGPVPSVDGGTVKKGFIRLHGSVDPVRLGGRSNHQGIYLGGWDELEMTDEEIAELQPLADEQGCADYSLRI